jgi:hypothetical protein
MPIALSVCLLNINTLVLCFISFIKGPLSCTVFSWTWATPGTCQGTSLCLNNRNKPCNTWRTTIWSA